MKSIFITLLLFFSLNSSSQQLVKYTIDNDVSIDLPKNSVLTDSLDQKMIKGNIDGVNVILVRAKEKNEKFFLKDEADLIDFYAGFRKGYSKSVNGKVVNEKILVIDHLKASEFQCKSKMNNLNITIDCLVVFLNNYAYTIQFFYTGSSNESYLTQKKAILSSLKFREGLNINHQLNNSLENTLAYKIGKIIGYFLGIAVLVILILVIVKKTKKKKLF